MNKKLKHFHFNRLLLQHYHVILLFYSYILFESAWNVLHEVLISDLTQIFTAAYVRNFLNK